MMLQCEQIPFSHLAEEFGTPLYVYSQSALTQALQSYTEAFSTLNPLICYAVKANSNLSIIRHFASLGCGFDIVSGGELTRVLAAGGDAAKTIFSGVGKSEAEIEFALNAGVKCFNMESIPEIDRIQMVAQRLGKIAPVSLRINPDVDPKTHPYISTGLKSNKFGIAYADAHQAFHYAAQKSHLKIIGIDCHIGSQLTDLSPLTEACERMLLLIDQLAEENIVLEHLDLGGGVGIVYQNETLPDLQIYAQSIHKLMGNRPLKLILEPGRSLVGNAGTLITRVEFIKKSTEKNFIMVDAAMNDLMRPALYGAYHHIESITPKNIVPFTADIVGPICETGDFLGKERVLSCEAGDLLAIHSVGAYAASMASNYNSRNKAAEVLVNGREAKLIRQRETLQQQMANELSCL